MKKLFTAVAFIAFVFAVPSTSQAQEVLKVAVDSGNAPFGSVDTPTSAPQGFSIDVVNAIAKDNGLQVQFVPMPFGQEIPALVAGQVDLIADSTAITPERKAAGVDFTDPYTSITDTMLVPSSDTTAYKSYSELKGKVVGTITGSVYAPVLQNSGLFADVKLYATGTELNAAISSGQVQGAITLGPALIYQAAKGQLPSGIRLVSSYSDFKFAFSSAMGVKKGNSALLGKINGSLAKMKSDGSLSAIAKKWTLAAAPAP